MEKIMTIEELNEACKDVKEQQALIDKLTEELELKKKLVKDYMDVQTTDTVTTEDYKVIWKMVNRKDVDRKKLEEDGLLEKYLKYSDYPQLRINSKKK